MRLEIVQRAPVLGKDFDLAAAPVNCRIHFSWDCAYLVIVWLDVESEHECAALALFRLDAYLPVEGLDNIFGNVESKAYSMRIFVLVFL